MTPTEAKALSLPEYLAFVAYMDRDLREQRRAARRKAKGRSG